MKRPILILITLLMVGIPVCLGFLHSYTQRTKMTTKDSTEFTVKSEKIMDELGVGLHKVELDSNTTILIYRADPASDGTESVSMIQLN
jgi:cell division protein YceG involved in septum cleavage